MYYEMSKQGTLKRVRPFKVEYSEAFDRITYMKLEGFKAGFVIEENLKGTYTVIYDGQYVGYFKSSLTEINKEELLKAIINKIQ